MDKDFGKRNVAIRIAWGERSRKGETASPASWSRELGVDPKSRRIYNLEEGRHPQGGLEELIKLYGPLRAKGADPRSIAIWVSTGEGAMPQRPAGGSVVPNVSAPSSPAPMAVQGAQPIVDAVSLFERARAVLPPGADEARAIMDFAIETLSKARRIGIAALGAVTLTLLVGGRAEAAGAGSNQDKEDARPPLRLLPGGRAAKPRRTAARRRAASA